MEATQTRICQESKENDVPGLAAALGSEEIFLQVLESLPSGILMVDQEGNMVLANAQVEKMFGYRREELLGRPVEMLLPEELRGRHAQYRRDFFAAPQSRPMGAGRDLQALARDGHKFPVEIGLVPVATSKGPRVLAAILDITERKRSEERLHASLREAEALLREVHHRVRNNLAVIDSLLSLQAGRASDPGLAKGLRLARNRVHVLATLYRAKHLTQVDLANFVRGLCEYLLDSYGLDQERIQLQLELSEIHLDLDRAVPLGLLLNELLSNTLQHAFPDGRPGRLAIELKPQPDGRACLVIADNGVGLPPDLNVNEGRFLGLRLANSLARQIGGAIEFQHDGGTTATVTFSPVSLEGRDHGEPAAP